MIAEKGKSDDPVNTEGSNIYLGSEIRIDLHRGREKAPHFYRRRGRLDSFQSRKQDMDF